MEQDNTMGILIWLLVGGLVGWIASMSTHTATVQGLLADIATGTTGALLGGWFITPLLGVPGPVHDGQHGPMSILASVAGAVVLLAVARLLRRGRSG